MERPIAIVTGGNRGIGLEVCRQLVEKKRRVILTSRNAKDGREAASALGVEFGELDVTSPESIAALVAFAKSLGPIDVVVNNAGSSFDGFNSEVVRKTLAVNLYGMMAVTDALAPLVRDGGRIVNVSSGMGNLGAFGKALQKRFAAEAITRAELLALTAEFAAGVAAKTHEESGWPSSAYRVSKAGLNTFTRIAARELAPRHIAVNAVDPGWVKTRMGGSSAPRSVAEGADTMVWAATLEGDTPTGKLLFDRAVVAF